MQLSVQDLMIRNRDMQFLPSQPHSRCCGMAYHICTRDVRLARYDAYFSPRQSNWGCFVSVRTKAGRSKDNNTGFAMNLLGLLTISIWDKATFVIICLGKQIVSWNLMTVHVGWYDTTRYNNLVVNFRNTQMDKNFNWILLNFYQTTRGSIQ